MIAIALAALLAPPRPPPQEPSALTSVPSKMVEATVYPETAAVRRRAELPSGVGTYVVPGLPYGLDQEALRVRAEGTEVVGVELRERVLEAAPDPRVEKLRADLRQLSRELAASQDAAAVDEGVKDHLLSSLEPDTGGDDRAAQAAPAAAPSVAAWEANLTYLTRELRAVQERQRARLAEQRDLARRIEELRLELGPAGAPDGVRVLDLIVDVFGADAPAVLEVDYLVHNAGWTPAYDLRVPKTLAELELIYRARVWQNTGEDWSEVALALSTAEPRRGASGPEPVLRWVDVRERRRPPARGEATARAPAAPAEAPAPVAEVRDEGLSVQLRLGRQTIASRAAATTLYVGRASLALAPEHYCVPALDPTVWLRAEATNTSDYVLLAGRAAVYVGADCVGFAELPAVQRGAKFELPLGSDPGVIVERVQLERRTEEAGVFGKKRVERGSWRIRLKNNGAFTRRPDGAVDVIVHESLPRSTDERIDVELERARPEPAGGERWEKLREERGVLTWVRRVPRGGEETIELETSIAYPEGETLHRR